MIRARGLTKHFGPVVAVDGVDLDIKGPGIVGFLGPNGAGKTTTMRMLTGFLPMTDGAAVVCGHDVFEAPLEVKARVGYLPETPPIYPELTVGEYLHFVAEIKGVSRSRRAFRVGAAMEQVGLTGWERRLTGSLSKGYRQRVGLAQALLADPSLLILDEPTSGLDPAQLVGIRGLIRELGQHRTVVLSTHVLPEVEAMCDRVLLIHQGRLVGDGTTQTLAAKVGAGRWLEVRLAGADADGTGRLAAVAGVASVQALEPGRFRVEASDAAPDGIAKLAAVAGWQVLELAWHQPSLEEVFLALVGAEG
ncbi:MAG: ABC-2 type transport system ATP-binding protein [Myxococcota bacterium]|jgi:ABC-2 type transport system ATP-binding protein